MIKLAGVNQRKEKLLLSNKIWLLEYCTYYTFFTKNQKVKYKCSNVMQQSHLKF